jgi:hypothetical protein
LCKLFEFTLTLDHEICHNTKVTGSDLAGHSRLFCMGNGKQWKWHEWELDLVELWAGTMPIPDLVEALNEERRFLGLPPRTVCGTKRYTWRRGISLRHDLTTGADYQPVQTWEQDLGLKVDSLYRLWQKSKISQGHVRRSRSKLNTRQVDRLLAKDPRTAAIAGAEKLRQFGLRRAFNAVMFADYLIPHTERRVRRSDGKEFATVKEAAKEMGVTRPTIYIAISRGTTSGGYHWRYIDMREHTKGQQT